MDFIIVGAGPTGLTLAWLLRKHAVTIIDSAPSIGGCHRVVRQNGEFTEHGPRVYSSAYKTVEALLQNIGTSWDDIFTPYKFNMGTIGGRTWQSLHARELLQLTSAYIQRAFGRDYSKTTMREFIAAWSESSRDYIERVCVLTDGQRADTYPVDKFLQLINQQMGLYKLYQPKAPNDEGLFKIWGDELTASGVTIRLNEKCLSVQGQTVITDKHTYTAPNIILAVPPRTLAQINVVPRAWADAASYIDYITVNFRFPIKSLPSTWGFPATAWGLAHIVVSDYWDGQDHDRDVTISCGITNVDAPDRNGKTARQSTDDYVVQETLNQLRESYPTLPRPTSAHIGSRIGQESAFVGDNFIPAQIRPGLYNAGTQNGKSQYAYTSMETAVANATALANELAPETRSMLQPIPAWTLNQALLLALVIVIVLVCVVYFTSMYTINASTDVTNIA